MEHEWYRALGKMVYGIYVLTTAHGKEQNGMIASWVTQVSHQPPLILAAVHPSRYSHSLIRQSGGFALHVIAKEQKALLAQFKGPDPAAKFSDLAWHKGKTGSPILQDCIAYLDCEVKESLAPGNHTLFIGQVIDGRLVAEGQVLDTGDYDGAYTGKS
ncbi:flavin reductase family protein [Desulfococcus sp.]|uniref:flavin reductase family protein n=1 Tax=Desulfococcus sp. TaxID=2025834 RepID=UPI00359380B6